MSNKELLSSVTSYMHGITCWRLIRKKNGQNRPYPKLSLILACDGVRIEIGNVQTGLHKPGKHKSRKT